MNFYRIYSREMNSFVLGEFVTNVDGDTFILNKNDEICIPYDKKEHQLDIFVNRLDAYDGPLFTNDLINVKYKGRSLVDDENNVETYIISAYNNDGVFMSKYSDYIKDDVSDLKMFLITSDVSIKSIHKTYISNLNKSIDFDKYYGSFYNNDEELSSPVGTFDLTDSNIFEEEA